MSIEIVVPAEQEGTKAVLKSWLKKPGDAVRIDEPVVEIETDKVAVEIAATADGVLAEILVEEGADVEPGRVLGRIEKGAAPGEKALAAGAGIAAPAIRSTPTAASQLPPGIRRLLVEHDLKPEEIP